MFLYDVVFTATEKKEVVFNWRTSIKIVTKKPLSDDRVKELIKEVYSERDDILNIEIDNIYQISNFIYYEEE